MANFNPHYELPYDCPEISSYIKLAKNLSQQADYAEASESAGIYAYDNTVQEVLPSLSDDKNIYLSPVILSAETMSLSFDAALKARSGENHVLNIALQKLEDLYQKKQALKAQLEMDIVRLNAEAETLRSDFSSATDSTMADQSISITDQAKTLLTTLETTYEKHKQLKDVNQYLNDYQENIEYINSKISICLEKINKLTAEQPSVKDRISNIRNYFDIKLPNEQLAQAEPAAELNSPTTALENARPSAGSLMWTYFKIILVALLLAFVIRAYVIDITKVDGTSMHPVLVDKDNIITAKIAYILNEPQRGDIIVFDAPDIAGADYVKRIIGLPNEEIVISEGKVYIDGRLLQEPYLEAAAYTDGDIRMIIPDGFYFVMGDNRAVSRDSRAEDVGFISHDLIHGKAVLRIFPFNSFGSIYR